MTRSRPARLAAYRRESARDAVVSAPAPPPLPATPPPPVTAQPGAGGDPHAPPVAEGAPPRLLPRLRDGKLFQRAVEIARSVQ